MPGWRREAIDRLPELREMIAAAPSVMSLWIDLWYPFCKAYEQKPRNEDFIRRVYSYADWCAEARQTDDAGTDPPTAVCCAFHEHLPTHPAVREDMPRWFTAEQVLKCRQIFSYHLNPEEYQALLDHMRKNSGQYRVRPGG